MTTQKFPIPEAGSSHRNSGLLQIANGSSLSKSHIYECGVKTSPYLFFSKSRTERFARIKSSIDNSFCVYNWNNFPCSWKGDNGFITFLIARRLKLI